MGEDRLRDGIVIHAGAVLVGEAGILILGRSGAGKSRLAWDLVAAAERDDGFGRLVADDRVALSVRNERLIARPVAALAGLIEIRGVGLARVPFEASCVIRLAVELSAVQSRLPDPAERSLELLGIRLPRIVVNGPSAPSVVLWRLKAQSNDLMTVR